MSAILTKMSNDDYSSVIDRSTYDTLTKYVKERYGEDITLIYTFPVLYQGWECDYVGMLVQTASGKMLAFGTNHGNVEELDKKTLEDRIKLYRTALRLTNRVLRLTNRVLRVMAPKKGPRKKRGR